MLTTLTQCITLLLEDFGMANVNVRMDEQIKAKAEAIFAQLGMTPTTAITLFYNQVIRTSSIPFALRVDVPNETTLKALEEVDEMESGKKDAKTYQSVDELMEELNR